MAAKADCPAPFPHSYWVVPTKFLAGYYPGSENEAEAEQKLRALLNHGLRTFIDLMEPWEVNLYGRSFVPYAPRLKAMADAIGAQVEFYRYGIKDLGTPSRELMTLILDRIDDSLKRDSPVFLHCLGGRGRTGTVVGCYLARHGLVSREKALEAIQDLRRNMPDSHAPSPETSKQRQMVRSWKKWE